MDSFRTARSEFFQSGQLIGEESDEEDSMDEDNDDDYHFPTLGLNDQKSGYYYY